MIFGSWELVRKSLMLENSSPMLSCNFFSVTFWAIITLQFGVSTTCQGNLYSVLNGKILCICFRFLFNQFTCFCLNATHLLHVTVGDFQIYCRADGEFWKYNEDHLINNPLGQLFSWLLTVGIHVCAADISRITISYCPNRKINPILMRPFYQI